MSSGRKSDQASSLERAMQLLCGGRLEETKAGGRKAVAGAWESEAVKPCWTAGMGVDKSE